MTIRQVELVIIALSFLVVGIILGVDWQKQRNESVIVDRIVTQNVTEYVDKVVIKEVPYELSSNTTISLNEALALLAIAKQPHAYMVAHPELANASTGDIASNAGWVVLYTSLEDFQKWQANRIKELEVEK